MTARTRLMVLGIVAIAACTPAAPATDPAADMAAVGRVREAWSTAWKAGDASGLAALYGADARDMGGNQPTASGTQEVQTAMTGFFSQFAPGDVTIRPEKTDVSGDIAYDRGTFTLTMTPKPGGPVVTDSGRFLVVLKRQADSTFKIVELMTNSSVPLPPPAPAPAGRAGRSGRGL